MTANAVRGFVKSAISANRVALFSKSYCPYCNLAKDVLKKAGVRKPFVIELDHRNDSQDVQVSRYTTDLLWAVLGSVYRSLVQYVSHLNFKCYRYLSHSHAANTMSADMHGYTTPDT